MDPLESKATRKSREKHGDGKVLFKNDDFTAKPARLKNVQGKETFKVTEVLAERKRKWMGEKGEFDRKYVKHWAYYMAERDYKAFIKTRDKKLSNL